MRFSQRVAGLAIGLAVSVVASANATSGHGLRDCVEPMDVGAISALPAQAKGVAGFEGVGNVAVIEYGAAYDRGTSEARMEVSKKFYQHHADEYDFLVVFTTFEFNTGEALAFYNPIRNDVQGVGDQIFDHSRLMGSAGRLQGYIDMAALARYDFNSRGAGFASPLNTLAHEVMHRWGVQVHFSDSDGSSSAALLGRDGAHWSLLADTDASIMYGARWEETAPGQFRISEARARLSPWDLYLAGFADASEVPPMRLVRDSSLDPTTVPVVGMETGGTLQTIPIQWVIDAEGERVPNADRAQRRFNAALVLLTRPGETVDPTVFVQLERFRHAFESYFQSITAGRASMSIGRLGSVTQAPIAAPVPLIGSPIQPAADPLSAGVAWLAARQRVDGHWEDRPGTSVRDTAMALAALAQVAPDHPAIGAGRAWLGQRNPRHADDAAWRLFENTMVPLPEDLALLEPGRANGVGMLPGWQSAVLDTALAVRASLDRGLFDAATRDGLLGFLALVQSAEGGFGYTVGGVPSARVSTLAARALLRASSPDHQAAGGRARTWLLERLGAGVGTPIGDSAELLRHAGILELPFELRANLLAGLLARQGADGDWGGSVYATSASLLGLALQTQPNYALSELGANPAEPVLGEPVVLRVRVRNNGGQSVPASAVQWFRNSRPGAGGTPVGAPYPIPSLLPGETLVATVTVEAADIAGVTTLVAAIDVDNAVVEASEDDNYAELGITVRPAYAGVDAALYAPDVSVSAPQVTHLGQGVTVAGVVRNLGNQAIASLPLSLYRRHGEERVELQGTTVAVVASGMTPFSLSFQIAELAPHQLELIADPHDAIVEFSETNNTLTLDIPYGDGVDLEIRPQDIVVTPEHPVHGDDLRIRVGIRNNGAADSPAADVVLEREVAGQWARLQRISLVVPAGSTSQREFLWRPDRSGEHRLRLVADPDDAIVELDATNNAAEWTVQVGSGNEPNLVVELGSIQFDPAPPREGRPLSVLATIRNLGQGNAEAFNVALYLGDPRAGGVRLAATRFEDGLAGGGSAAVQLDVPDYPAWGDATLFVLADSEAEVAERNEDDNIGLRETIARRLGDLAVEAGGIRLEPSAPVYGTQVRATVEVANIGEQATEAVQASLFEHGPPGSAEVLPTRAVPRLEPGATFELEWTWTFGQVSEVSLLTVLVDPENLEREHRETNNEATISLSTQSGSAFTSELHFSPNGDGVRDRTTAWFVLAPSDVETVLIRDLRGYTVADLGSALVRLEDRVAATWDGRTDEGTVAPDGSYAILARMADGRESERVYVELDTNRPTALDSVHTDRGVTRVLPESENPWQRTPEGSAGDEYVFAVGSSYNTIQSRKRGVFRSHLLMGGVESVVSVPWLDRYAQANNLQRADIWQLEFSPHAGNLWMVLQETPRGSGATRWSLWSQSPLETNTLYRVLEFPASVGWAPKILGAFDDERALIAEYYDYGERWIVDMTTGALTLLARGSDYEYVQEVYPEGVLLRDGGLPTTFVHSDAAQTQVDLDLAVPNGACFSRTQLQPGVPRLLHHVVVPNREYVDILDLRTGNAQRVIDVDLGDSSCIPFMPGQETRDRSGSADNEADARRAKAAAPAGGGYGMAYVVKLRPFWMESLGQLWIQDYSAGLLRRFAATGQALSQSPIPAVELHGEYDELDDYVSPERISAELLSPDWYLCGSTINPSWDDLAEKGKFERTSYDPIAKAFHLTHGEVVSAWDGYSDWGRYCEGAVGFWRLPASGSVQFQAGLTHWPLVDPADQERYPMVQLVGDAETVVLPEAWPQFIHRNGTLLREDGRIQRVDGGLTRPWAHAAGLLDAWPSESRLALDTSGDRRRFDAAFSTLDRMSAVLRANSDGRAIRLSGLATDRNFERFSIDYAYINAPDDWLALVPATREEVVFDDFMTWAPAAAGAYLFRLTVTDSAGNRTSRYASGEVYIGSPIVRLVQNHRSISPNGDGVQDFLQLDFEVVRATEQRFRVVDEAARIVYEQDRAYGANELGPQTWIWDGRDNDGAPVPEGRYRVELSSGFAVPVLLDITPPSITGELEDTYPPVAGVFWACAEDHYGNSRSIAPTLKSQRQFLGSSVWADYGNGRTGCFGSKNRWFPLVSRLEHRYRIVAVDSAGNEAIHEFPAPSPLFSLSGAEFPGYEGSYWQSPPFQSAYATGIPEHYHFSPPHSSGRRTLVAPRSDVPVFLAADPGSADGEVLVDLAVLPPSNDEDEEEEGRGGEDELDWRTIHHFTPAQSEGPLYRTSVDLTQYHNQKIAMRLRRHSGSGVTESNAFVFDVGGVGEGCVDPLLRSFSVFANLVTPHQDPHIQLLDGSNQILRPKDTDGRDYPVVYGFEIPEGIQLPAYAIFRLVDGAEREWSSQIDLAFCEKGDDPLPKLDLKVGVLAVEACDATPAGLMRLSSDIVSRGPDLQFALLLDDPRFGPVTLAEGMGRDFPETGVVVPTRDLPEGEVAVRLRYANAAGNEAETLALFPVDHSPPYAQILRPGPGDRVCTNPTGGSISLRMDVATGSKLQWLVEAASGDGLPLLYENVCGSGDGCDREAWDGRYIAPEKYSMSEEVATDSLLKIMDPGFRDENFGMVPPDGPVSLRLRSIDWSGAQACSTVQVRVDAGAQLFERRTPTPVFGPAPLTRVMLSSHPAAQHTSAQWFLGTKEPLRVTGEIYRTEGRERSYGIVGSPLTRFFDEPAVIGNFAPAWSAVGGGLEDGTYGVVFRGEDDCGHVRTLRYLMTIDSVSPELDLVSPAAGAQLRVGVVEFIASIRDAYPDDYELAVGPGASGPWETLFSGSGRVQDPTVLYQWPTYGATGQFFVKVGARDAAGNRSETIRPFVLLERPVVIDAARTVPTLFSPNADGVLDASEVEVTLRRPALLDISVSGAGPGGTRVLTAGVSAVPGVFRVPWDGALPDGIARDGDYRVLIKAKDAELAGVEDELELTVAVDATYPAISAIQPEGAFAKCDAAATFEVADAHLVDYDAVLLGLQGNLAASAHGQQEGAVEVASFDFLPEGPYRLEIHALDAAGNRSLETRDFTLDCTPPEVALIDPEESALVIGGTGREVEVVGSATDENFGSWRLEAIRASDPASPMLLAEGTEAAVGALLHAWKTAVPDGDYRLRLTAVDRAGNEAVAEVAVTVDGTPPEAKIQSPPDGALVSRIVLEGIATDAHFSRYRIDVATPVNAAAGAWSTAFVGEAPVQDGRLAEFELAVQGAMRIRLVVTDAVGLESSDEIGLTLDTIPPPNPVGLVASVEASYNVRLNWQGGEAPDLAGYHVYRDGARLTGAPLPTRMMLDVDVPEGTWKYFVTAVDEAGNESAPSNIATARIDRTPPEVEIARPGNGERIRGLVEVVGTAYSEDDFDWFELLLVDSDTGAIDQLHRGGAPVRNGLLHRWDTRAFPEDAVLRLRLVGADRSGNTAHDEVEVVVDNLPPAAPTGLVATLRSPDVQVDWNPNTEPDLLGYLLYRNGSLVDFSGSLPADLRPYSIPENAYLDQRPPDGELVYRVYAIDLAGNISLPSDPASVVRDENPPHVEIVRPQEGLVFDAAIEVAADSPERDIAEVRFAWRALGDSAWNPLGSPLTERPWRTTFDPEGLEYGPYELTAVATDEGGLVDPQPQVVQVEYADLTPPAPPTGLVARADGDEVTAQWDANTEDDLSGYLVERLEPDGTWTALNADPIADLALVDPDREVGAYVYRVFAQDTYGNVSEPSEESTAHVFVPQIRPAPYTPTSEGQTALKGTGGSRGGEAQLRIESPGGVRELEPGAVGAFAPFTFEGLALDPGPNEIALRVLDAEGNRSLPAVTWLTRGLVPEPPAQLDGSVAGGAVALTWSPSASADVAGYRVYRDGLALQDDVALSQDVIATSLGDPVPEVTDDDPSTTWDLQADVLDDRLDGRLELEWAVPALVGVVRIQWRDDQSSARDFDLEGWFDGRWNRIASVRNGAGSLSLIRLSDAYPTDRLRLRLLRTQSYGGEVALAEISLCERAFAAGESAADAPPQGRHEYAVAALSTLGFEGARSAAWIAEIGDAQAPDPVVLSGTLENGDGVLEWTESTAADLSHYELVRGDATVAQVEAGQPRAFRDASLPNGTHRYVVYAVDQVGNRSDPSNAVELVFSREGPGKPTILRASPRPEQPALEVEWVAGAGPVPVSYRLFYSHEEAGTSDPYRQLAEVPVTTFVHTGLTFGERIYYRVQAVDGRGNLSELSDPVSGLVADISTPSAPRLTWPTVPGRPVTLSTRAYDVCGIAEPGTTVRISINGAEAASGVPVTPSDGVRTVNNAYGHVYDWALTPDGRSLLASNYGLGQVYSVDTGEVTQSGAMFHGQYLSVDRAGAKLYSHTDGSIMSWSFDGRWTPNELWPDFWSVTAFAVAPGEATILAKGYLGWAEELWLKRRDSGEILQVGDDGYSIGDFLFTPDGQKAWIARSDSLQLLDVATGTASSVIEDVELGRNIDVSGSGEVLYVAADGVQATVEVRARTPDGVDRLIAQRMEPVHDVAWSPDAQSVALLLEDRVEIVGAADGGLEGVIRHPDFYFGGYDRMRWAGSWHLLVYSPDSWERAYLIDPAGRFCARNLEAAEGLNVVDAVAERPSGVRSQRSLPIELNVDRSAGLPDLRILSEDIRFVPAAGEPGQSYGAIVTVRSRFPEGTSHQGVAGRATLIAPDGSYRGLPEFAQLGNFDDSTPLRAFSLALGTLDQAGDYLLQIELDPSDAVAESDETNNVAMARLHLASAGSARLQLSADTPTLAPGAAFGGYVTVTGSTGFSGQVRLDVLDQEGAPVFTVLQEAAGPLQFAVPWSRRWEWLPESDLFADTYLLQAKLFDAAGTLIDTRSLSLQIQALSDLRLHLQPATATGIVGDLIPVQFGLDYLAGNQVLADGTLHLLAIDAIGAETSLWQGATGVLMPGYTLRRSVSWNTAAVAPGAARLRLRFHSVKLERAVEREVVLVPVPPVARLAGTLALVPGSRMVLGERTPRLDYRVQSVGELAIPGVHARVVLREEGGDDVLLSGQVQGALAPGQTLQGELALDPLPQRPQAYFAVLEAHMGDGAWQVLAQLGFAAVDAVAPRITVLSPDPAVPHRSPALLAADIVDEHSRVASAAYRIDGSAWRPLGVQGNRYEAVMDGLADGEHEAVIRAEDTWGNERIGEPFRFVADSTPPLIIIEGVSDGQVSSQPLFPRVSVIDAHPDRLSVWLDGVPFTSGDEVSSDGVHTLTAIAVDAAGNRSDAELTFTLDTGLLPVEIIDPPDGTSVFDASIPVRVETEPHATVILRVGGGQSSRDADADGIAFFGAVPLVPGSNLVSAIARDAAGNLSAPDEITVYRLNLVGELNGSVLPAVSEVARGTDLEAMVTIANETALDYDALPLRVRALGASGTLDTHAVDVAIASGASVSYPIAFPTDGWALGGVTLELAALLEGDWQVLGTGTVTLVDRDRPSLTPLAPEDGSLSRNPVQLRALAEDDEAVAGVFARIDAGAWMSLAGIAGNQWLGEASPADGPHQVVFRAADGSGNETISAPIGFTVDTTPPQIVITGVADGGLYGSAVQIQVSVLDANPGTLTVTLNGAPYANGTPVDATGTYVLHAEAQDAVGLVSKRTLGFELDLDAPFIHIDTPVDGVILLTPTTAVGGSTRPHASVTVSGETSTHSVTADADGHYGVDAVELVDGPNVLRAVAVDRLGRTSPEAAVTVYRSDGSLGLEGQLSATPALLPADATLDLAYRVDERLGLERVGVPLRLRVLRAGGAAGVFERITVEGIPASGHVAGIAEASALGWSLGSYAAELSVELEGSWHALATAGFEIVDVLPPQVAFVAPAIDSYHATSVAVAVAASDVHSAVASVEVRVGTGAWVALAPSQPDQPWTGVLASPGDGPAILQARARDTAGNVSPAVERAVVFDATPPVITIAGVTDGELRNTPATPSVSVEDASPVDLTVTMNGAPWVSGTTVSADGVYLLHASALDAAGNTAEASVQFEIDATPPAVVLISPEDGAVLRGPTVDVTGATEPHATVELIAGGTGYGAQADAGGAFVVPRVALALGDNEIAARATDAAGNTGDYVRITVERRGKTMLRGDLEAPSSHDRSQPLPVSVRLHNETDEPIERLPVRVTARLSDGREVDLDLRQVDILPRSDSAYELGVPTHAWPPGNALLQLLANSDPDRPDAQVLLATAQVTITGGAQSQVRLIPADDARWMVLIALLLAVSAMRSVGRRERCS